jgi:hypothetical protein
MHQHLDVGSNGGTGVGAVRQIERVRAAAVQLLSGESVTSYLRRPNISAVVSVSSSAFSE